MTAPRTVPNSPTGSENTQGPELEAAVRTRIADLLAMKEQSNEWARALVPPRADELADTAPSPRDTTTAVLTGHGLVRAALEGNPRSDVSAEVESDGGVGADVAEQVTDALLATFQTARDAGVSGYGVLALTTLQAVQAAKDAGVHPFQIASCLNELIGMVMQDKVDQPLGTLAQ